MKTVFPKRIDGKLLLCPFKGYEVKDIEDFINLMKSFYNKETGYPGLYFHTKDPKITIVFSGHQYEHPEGKTWSLFYEGDKKPSRWFSIKDPDKSWFELFEDTDVLNRKLEALSKLFSLGCSIEFTLP